MKHLLRHFLLLLPLGLALTFGACRDAGSQDNPLDTSPQSGPYVTASTQNDPYNATSVEELAGQRVAVNLGSVHDADLSVRGGYNLIRLNSISEMLMAVEKGIADYALMDSPFIIGVDLKARGLKVNFCGGYQGDAAFGVRHDNSELAAQYNRFFQEFKQSGRYAQTLARWTTGDGMNATMPDIPRCREGKPLRIGILSTDYPFSFIKDGEIAGLEAELILEFAAWLGRPAEFSYFDLGAIIGTLVTGKVDLIAAFMFITEERSRQVLFTDPYMTVGACCLSRSGSVQETRVGIWQKLKNSFHNNLIVEDRWKMLVDGLWATLVISVLALLLGTLLGALLCWMRMSRRRWIRSIGNVYTEIMRDIPLLVILMIMFYVVFARSGLNAIGVAVVTFAMVMAAFVGEIFRVNIAAVDRGQTEAGLAMGFTPAGTFFRFVLPQAVRKILPVYKGEAVSLVKNTSIVGYIAIQDLTRVSDIIRSRTFDAFFPLIIVSIVYFALTWLLSLGLDALNKDNRKAL